MNIPVSIRWFAILILLLVAITLPFVWWEDQITDLTDNLLAIRAHKAQIASIVVVVLAADIVLPVPSSIASTLAGAALGWVSATVFSCLGMTIGCALGYWIGRNGGAPLARKIVSQVEFSRAQKFSQNVGMTTIVLARAVPVLAEISVLAAGAMQYPFKKFIFATFLGNLGISAVYGFVGFYAYETQSFLLAFFAAVLVPLVGLGLGVRLKNGRK